MTDEKTPRTDIVKFSDFATADGEGIEGVGLKGGQNVRFALTTDSVQVNPNPFRNAKGQFAPTPEELAKLKNQRDVNEFLYAQIEKVEGGEINLDGYATTEQLTQVNDASELRDEALNTKIEDESTQNTAAHAAFTAGLADHEDRITELEKEPESNEVKLEGTLRWVNYTYTSENVDALVATIRVHTDRSRMSLNWDTISDGRKNWATLINDSVGLEVDGTMYWATVEYTGEAGQSGRGKNFKILDHNIPPVEEIANDSITGIYPDYLPEKVPAGTHVGPNPPENPEEGATWYDTVRLELFVYAEDAWLPCSPLGARVEQGEILQAEILGRVEAGEVQQQTLTNKVNALEGVVGEHSFLFTSANSNPRPGEFNLKDSQMQLVNTISAATVIYLNDTDRDGNTINFSRITEGDVLRLASIDGQMAELKVNSGSEGIYVIEKVNGDLDRMSEMPYEFILLSSFDPAGLATIDYVDAQDGNKLGKAESNEVSNSFRIKGAGGTYLSAANGELGLFHLKTPTDKTHAVNKEYVDQHVPNLWKWNPSSQFLVANQKIYWQDNEASNRYEFYVAVKAINGMYDIPEFTLDRTDNFQLYFRDGENLKVIARADYYHIRVATQGTTRFFWVFVKKDAIQIWRPEIAARDDLVNCHIGGFTL